VANHRGRKVQSRRESSQRPRDPPKGQKTKLKIAADEELANVHFNSDKGGGSSNAEEGEERETRKENPFGGRLNSYRKQKLSRGGSPSTGKSLRTLLTERDRGTSPESTLEELKCCRRSSFIEQLRVGGEEGVKKRGFERGDCDLCPNGTRLKVWRSE